MTQINAPIEVQQHASGLVSWNGWLKELNRTRACGHRWRKSYPWLDAGIVNVFGKLYIRRDTIAEFERRAIAGELTKPGHGFIAEAA